ncbi:hypothetical protein O3M35_001795 [Rhynocoris fuscipes]|uniref:Uncharacterized protein n=1 Tax=Rhynocoris fuscipes TaxID=488301 RepID=A0AAW1CPV8_9HEMI
MNIRIEIKFLQKLPQVVRIPKQKNCYYYYYCYFAALGRISENCTVADVQFHERLASNSKDLEKCYESTCARNNRYKLFLNKLKVTEEELLAVKTEIESDDKEDDDTTLSMLNRMFQQLKKDMNFVLDKLVPENKDSVKELLSNLQKNRNEWHKINDDIEVSVVMMLLNANVIVQHPELKNYFKLAPLCDD